MGVAVFLYDYSLIFRFLYDVYFLIWWYCF